MTTSRTDFNSTWLIEMPQNIGAVEMFDMLEYNIKDQLKSKAKVIDLKNGLKKIDGERVKYYWYEQDGNILLGAELSVRPQGLVVNALGKNRKIKSNVYASELYDAILKDTNRSIKLLSDIDMSEEAFKVWSRLLQQGHKISVYDRNAPGQSFVTLNTVDDMRKYFQDDDTDFRRYQFVLSETHDILAETRSHFNTRRMRELAGVGLDD